MTFEEFAAARLPALLRYAHMLTGDPYEAQDLVQDTLVRVQLKWWRVRRADRPELYVRRMLTNVYLGWRRHSRWKRDVLTDDPTTAGGSPARTLRGLGEVYAATGDSTRAREAWDTARALFTALGLAEAATVPGARASAAGVTG